ncbi:MAG: hypothetical protein C4297_00125 [Gemmataceae bacterium]
MLEDGRCPHNRGHDALYDSVDRRGGEKEKETTVRRLLGRSLQLIGLVLVPVAIAGNLAEMADARHGLDLKQSLLLSACGIGIFYLGRLMDQAASS